MNKSREDAIECILTEIRRNLRFVKLPDDRLPGSIAVTMDYPQTMVQFRFDMPDKDKEE